ncbi:MULTISPECIES: S8 family peptidase [Mediterraneibacter]|uniref:S8 family peptidase n=1 Tax=Mediterraneibacter TaxID=2316020 RepID=UPI0022DEBA65|nr:S8 family peptidase [Mediterraneibacter massiliensis]
MRWVKETTGYWCEDTISGKYIGQGVCAAILDTGIAQHPDFAGRILAFKDFTGQEREAYDDSGHGTHVAGILAGSGCRSQGNYAGMAPKAGLLIGKVLDKEGNGAVRTILDGIEWLTKLRTKYSVRIVNISVGTHPDLEKYQKELLLEAVEDLWDQGVVVVVSAGNYGPEAGTVAVPGNSPKVITVGVPDYAETSVKLPVIGGKGKIKNYSGRGPTEQCVVKPDVLAPGTGVISCNSRFNKKTEGFYTSKSGTSMATPVVAGAIACLLSKEPDMTNAEVKLKLRASCTRREKEPGWGMLQVEKLLSRST